VLTISAALLVLVPALALAQWSENFDSYPVGPLVPQGGWEGWGGNPAATLFIVNILFHSPPNSAESRSTTDCVHRFSGVNVDLWSFINICFIPTGALGEQYFILLNTYPAGPLNNWSTQILIDMTANVVLDFDNPNGPAIPIVRDQWIEVRVDIDFDTDTQSMYYNGQLINQKSWTGGVAPGGALNLAALDIYSNNASSIYYDDFVLRESGPVPVEPTSWGQIKASFR
jgi:hypothetical protein